LNNGTDEEDYDTNNFHTGNNHEEKVDPNEGTFNIDEGKINLVAPGQFPMSPQPTGYNSVGNRSNQPLSPTGMPSSPLLNNENTH